MTVAKYFRVMINFKKQCLPVIIRNKEYMSKQVVPIADIMEKTFIAVTIVLNVCELFLFRESKKIVVYFGLYQSSSFSREDQKILFIRRKFFFSTCR